MNLADGIDRHPRVARGGVDVAMAEQVLDHPHINALLEEVRGKAMPQRVWTDVLVKTGIVSGLAKGPLHGTRRDWAIEERAWKEEIAVWLPALPVAPQDCQVLTRGASPIGSAVASDRCHRASGAGPQHLLTILWRGVRTAEKTAVHVA